MLETILDIVKNSIAITFVVLSMMALIEFINVKTSGTFTENLQKSKWKQMLLSMGLGIIPGCMGSYTVVSLYSHSLISFGALTAAFIVTLGDDIFILLSLSPSTALIIISILVCIAIPVGLFIHNRSSKHSIIKKFPVHFAIHEHEHEHISLIQSKQTILKNLQEKDFKRFFLLIFLVTISILAALGHLGHSHDFVECTDHAQHGHEEEGFDLFSLTYIAMGIVMFYIILIIPKHFLEEHIWNHVIKKHGLKLLLWTLTILTVIFGIQEFIDFKSIISHYYIYILLAAILIGIIPSSGPHILFITLYISGSIPISILLANSIVQDGHAGLPLIAESKRTFVFVKLIKIAIALVVGLVGLSVGL